MFKKILVAVDGSEPSQHALKVAADLAQEQGAELTILTVVPNLPPLIADDMTPEYLPQYQQDLEKSHQQMLNKVTRELKKTHPKLKTVPILMNGRPAKQITYTAQAREADLIVIGNRGTSGVLTWMLGSVSRQVTESCTAPVLVVKDQLYCKPS